MAPPQPPLPFSPSLLPFSLSLFVSLEIRTTNHIHHPSWTVAICFCLVVALLLPCRYQLSLLLTLLTLLTLLMLMLMLMLSLLRNLVPDTVIIIIKVIAYLQSICPVALEWARGRVLEVGGAQVRRCGDEKVRR